MIRHTITAAVLACSVAVHGVAHADEMENLARMERFIGVMQGYFKIIEATHEVASHEDKSAIMQLQKIEEIYKNRGDRAEAITVLRQVVKNADSDAVRNAATMMLADALNETGQSSEAVKTLKDALGKHLQ